MSILVQDLLTFLVLSACLGDMVTPGTYSLQNNMLKESIILLDQFLKKEVPCNKMNVTNIFADRKREDNMEIFCKAATIVGDCQPLEGVYDNLLSLVAERRAQPKKPCPVAAGSTTSLKNFLKKLYQVLQEEYKRQK